MTFDDFLTRLESLARKQKRDVVGIAAEMVMKEHLKPASKQAQETTKVRLLRDGRKVFYS